MIVTLLFICISLMLLYYYSVQFSRKGRLINRIPGYTQFPILGDILRCCYHTPEELWVVQRNIINRFYPITKFWFFTIPNVVICHPDHVEVKKLSLKINSFHLLYSIFSKKILSSTKHNEKGYLYNLLRPWLRDGLLLSVGKKWHNRRKILTPAFHFSILKRFVEILIEEGNSIKESFNHTEETVIENLLSFTSHHTLNAICETSMGISLKDTGSFQKQYRQTVHDIGLITINRFFKPWLLSDTIFNLTSQSDQYNKCLKTLHSFTEKIIAERRRYHEQTGEVYLKHLENDTEDTEIYGIKKKRMAMLDILIAEFRNNGLTDLDIREEVDTFMFEGHDTVATAVCFSLLLLAENKDIQDRVRKEICEVMQENDGKLTMNALQNLSYLERCLKESMRMYPSVSFIARVCGEDVQLGSYVVPKGTTVHILIYDMHRDRNFWTNPEVFDPDRFLPENMQKLHIYSYMPFSIGPRNCIGQRFAMLELKALIASMVYNFYLEPIDYLKDIKLKMDIVLRPSGPIRMKIIPIKRT